MIIHKVKSNTKLLEVVIIVILLMIYQGGSLYAAPVTHNISGADLVISAPGDYVVTGTTTTNQIVVNTGVTANITLQNVNINTVVPKTGAFELQGTANVVLTLVGTNTLLSGDYFAGLQVPKDSILTIKGIGALLVSGGLGGAGIGGAGSGSGANSGKIVIDGGDITATGGGGNIGSAGIGGGENGALGELVVNAGRISTYGLQYSAAIGSGGGGVSGGLFKMYGGTVELFGPHMGNELGRSTLQILEDGMITQIFGGSLKCGNPSFEDGSGNIMIRKRILLPSGATSISSVTVDNIPQKITSLHANDKQLNLYLPVGTHNIVVVTNAGTVTENNVSIGSNMNLSQGDVVIHESGNYSITGTSTINSIKVVKKSKATARTVAQVTVNNVSAKNNAGKYVAFYVSPNTDVEMILIGSNHFSSGMGKAAVMIHKGSTINIKGEGSITAHGGADGAGIGGGYRITTGKTTITSGTVTAVGYGYAPGIGSGVHYEVDGIDIFGGNITSSGGINGAAGIGTGHSTPPTNINIYGGNIKAQGAGEGAGIGGGVNSHAGNINIYGGNIVATGSFGGAGIGGGGHGGNGGNIVITGGTVTGIPVSNPNGIGSGVEGAAGIIAISGGSVKGARDVNRTNLDPSKGNLVLKTVIPLSSGVTGITAVTVDGKAFNVNSMHPNNELKLYLYLTPGTHDVKVVTTPVATSLPPIVVKTETDLSKSDVIIHETGSGPYEITGKSNTNKIVVNDGVTADIVFNDIMAANTSGFICAFEIGAGAVVNLTLKGDNILSSGESRAGLQLTPTSTLNIKGNGTLTITGGANAAGIGGGYSGNGGNVIIKSGKIIITAGSGGAGIGGGARGANLSGIGGNTIIEGGEVIITAGLNAAGIGGGSNGPGGITTINGGTVTLTGEIGPGLGGKVTGEGKTTINGGSVKGHGEWAYVGTDVGLLREISVGANATAVSIDGKDYKISKPHTNDSNIYVYLTEGEHPISVTGGTSPTSPIKVAQNLNLSNDHIIIHKSGNYNITGKTDNKKIVVLDKVNADLTLNGVVSQLAKDNSPALELFGTANATLNLVGENMFKSGKNSAGIQIAANSTLTIDGNGAIVAMGGEYGAGIGGGYRNGGGNITINNGKITALGGVSAAGIGGGYALTGLADYMAGLGANVTINGGNVMATGKANASATAGGAGIGGGAGGDGGPVTITGGISSITGGAQAAGIGGGAGETYHKKGNGSNVIISGGKNTINGGNQAAGIGGGIYFGTAQTSINGGTTVVNAGSGADGIGRGYASVVAGGSTVINGGSLNTTSISTKPINSKQNLVYKHTVTVEGVSNATLEAGYTLGNDTQGKGISVYLDSASQIYLYQEAATKPETVSIIYSNNVYKSAIAIGRHHNNQSSAKIEYNFIISSFDDKLSQYSKEQIAINPIVITGTRPDGDITYKYVGKNGNLYSSTIAPTTRGEYSVTAYLQGADIGHATLTITAKTLTPTITPTNKEYDATLNVVVVTTLDGIISGDDVKITLDAAFADKNVGNNKNIVLSNLVKSGIDSDNYAINLPTITANITPIQLEWNGLSVTPKTYDGNKNASVTGTLTLKPLGNKSYPSGESQANLDLLTGSMTAIYDSANVTDSSKVIVTLDNYSINNNNYIMPNNIIDIGAKIGAAIPNIDVQIYPKVPKMLKPMTVTITISNPNGEVSELPILDNISINLPASFKLAANGALKPVAGKTNVYEARYDVPQIGVSDPDVPKIENVVSNISLSATNTGNYAANQLDPNLQVTDKYIVNIDATASKIDPTYGDIITLNATVENADTLNQEAKNGVNGTVQFSILVNGALEPIGAPVTLVIDASNNVQKKVASIDVPAGTLKAGNQTVYAVFTCTDTWFIHNERKLNPIAVAKKNITIANSDIKINDKAYDAKADVDVTYTITNATIGILAGDILTLSGKANYIDVDAGINKTATLLTPTPTSIDAKNYNISVPNTGITGTINRRTIRPSVTVNKVYDASLEVDAIYIVGRNEGIQQRDEIIVTGAKGDFATKAAGNGKTVVLRPLTANQISGKGSTNYIIETPNQIGNISKKVVTLNTDNILATPKTYDKFLNATVTGSLGLNGIVVNDTVNIGSGTLNGVYETFTAGTAKPVIFTPTGYVLSGIDAPNYELIPEAKQVFTKDIGTINKAPLRPTPTVFSREYDGTKNAKIEYSATNAQGVIADDMIYLTGSGTFADKNAGNGIAVTAQNITNIAGIGGANYEIILPTGLTANITKRTLDWSTDNIRVIPKAYDGDTTVDLEVNSGVLGFSNYGIGDDETDLGLTRGTYKIAYDSATAGSVATENAKTIKITGITGYSITNALAQRNYNLPTTTSVDMLEQEILKATPTLDVVIEPGVPSAGKTMTVTFTLTNPNGLDAKGVLPTATDISSVAKCIEKNYTEYIELEVKTPMAAVPNKPGVFQIVYIVPLTNEIILDVSLKTSNNYMAVTKSPMNIEANDKLTVVISVTQDKNVVTYGNSAADTINVSASLATDPTEIVAGNQITGTVQFKYSIGDTKVSVGAPINIDATKKANLAITGAMLKAGTYNLYATYIRPTDGAFGNSEKLIGTVVVNKKAVTWKPDSISIPNRQYDGSKYTGFPLDEYGVPDKTKDSIVIFSENGVNENNAILPNDKINIKGQVIFADANASANAKPVTIDIISQYGNNAQNYAVTMPTNMNAMINKKKITWDSNGIKASDKVYDGNSETTLIYGRENTQGIVGEDIITLTGLGDFVNANNVIDKNVALNAQGIAMPKDVLPRTPTSITGFGSENYDITLPKVEATITPKPITWHKDDILSNMLYNKGTATTFTGAKNNTQGIVAGDIITLNGTATLNTNQVGDNIAITPISFTQEGSDKDNYKVTLSDNMVGSISRKPINTDSSSIVVDNMQYTGNTLTTTTGNIALVNEQIENGDVLSLKTGDVIANFNDKNVGSGKNVNVSLTKGGLNGYALEGLDAHNYELIDAPDFTVPDKEILNATLTLNYANEGANTLLPNIEYSVVQDGNILTQGTTSTPLDNIGYKGTLASKTNEFEAYRVPHKIFDNWYIDDQVLTSSDIVFNPNDTVFKHVNVKAKWVDAYEINYIFFDPDNAVSKNMLEVIRVGENIVAIPVTSRANYTHTGWSTNADGSGTVYDNESIKNLVPLSDMNLYAVYKANQNYDQDRSIIFDTQGGTPIPEKISIKTGDTLGYRLLQNIVKDGYVFKGWNLSRTGTGAYIYADTKLNDNLTGASSANKEITIYAIWEISTEFEQVIVTFDPNGTNNYPASVQPQSITIKKGDALITLPIPTRLEYKFLNWLNEDLSVFQQNTSINSNITLKANWEAQGADTNPNRKITITFDTNGADQASVANIVINKGDSINSTNLPKLTRTGFDLVGYKLNTIAGANLTLNTIFNMDTTLVAIWREISNISIEFYKNVTASETPFETISNVLIGGKITLPANPSIKDKTFLGYNTKPNGTGLQLTENTLITSEYQKVYAQWQVNIEVENTDRTIYFSPNGGNPLDLKQTLIKVGDTLGSNMPTTPIRSGYTFLGYNTMANGLGSDIVSSTPLSDTFTGMDKDNKSMTIYAIWHLNDEIAPSIKRILNFNANGIGGVIVGNNPINILVGEAVGIGKLPSANRSGYIFKGFNSKMDRTGYILTETMVLTDTLTGMDKDNRTITYYAMWDKKDGEAEKVQVIFNQAYDISNPTQVLDIEKGKSFGANLPQPIRDNYTFVHWVNTIDNAQTVFTSDTIVNANIEVYAVWEIKKDSLPIENIVTISFDKNGADQIDIPNIQIKKGDSIHATNLPLLTKTNAVFSHFSIIDANGAKVTNETKFDADTKLFANWIENFNITFDIDSNSGFASGNAPSIRNNVAYGSILELPNQTEIEAMQIVTGMKLEGWYTAKSGMGKKLISSTKITKEYEIVYANYTLSDELIENNQDRTIRFDSNRSGIEGMDATPNMVVVKVGDKLGARMPSIPTKEGYIFKEWSSNKVGKGIIISNDTTLSDDNTGLSSDKNNKELMLYAIWEIDPSSLISTVTLEGNGGTVDGSTNIAVVNGNSIGFGNLPKSIRQGYIFTGYMTNDRIVFDETTIVNKDITIYAQWKYDNTIVDDSKIVSVFFNANNGTSDVAEIMEVLIGDTIGYGSMPIPTKPNYTLVEWNTLADGSGNKVVPGNTPILENMITIVNQKKELQLFAQYRKVLNYTLTNTNVVYNSEQIPAIFTVTEETSKEVITLLPTDYQLLYTKMENGIAVDDLSTTPGTAAGQYEVEVIILNTGEYSLGKDSVGNEKEYIVNMEIAKKQLVWNKDALVVNNKQYDSNNTASLNGLLALNGTVGNDKLILTQPSITASYEQIQIGDNISVNVIIGDSANSIIGDKKDNYILPTSADSQFKLKGNILKSVVDISIEAVNQAVNEEEVEVKVKIQNGLNPNNYIDIPVKDISLTAKQGGISLTPTKSLSGNYMGNGIYIATFKMPSKPESSAPGEQQVPIIFSATLTEQANYTIPEKINDKTVNLTEKKKAVMTATVTEYGAQIEGSITDNTLDYGQSLTISIDLAKAIDEETNPTGYVYATTQSGRVISSNFDIHDMNATITLTKTQLSAGNYDIQLVYSGNTKYASGILNLDPILVKQKELTWDTTDIKVISKLYDGNLSANLSGKLKLNGAISNDNIGLIEGYVIGKYQSDEPYADGNTTNSVILTPVGYIVQNRNYLLPDITQNPLPEISCDESTSISKGEIEILIIPEKTIVKKDGVIKLTIKAINSKKEAISIEDMFYRQTITMESPAILSGLDSELTLEEDQTLTITYILEGISQELIDETELDFTVYLENDTLYKDTSITKTVFLATKDIVDISLDIPDVLQYGDILTFKAVLTKTSANTIPLNINTQTLAQDSSIDLIKITDNLLSPLETLILKNSTKEILNAPNGSIAFYKDGVIIGSPIPVVEDNQLLSATLTLNPDNPEYINAGKMTISAKYISAKDEDIEMPDNIICEKEFNLKPIILKYSLKEKVVKALNTGVNPEIEIIEGTKPDNIEVQISLHSYIDLNETPDIIEPEEIGPKIPLVTKPGQYIVVIQLIDTKTQAISLNYYVDDTLPNILTVLEPNAIDYAKASNIQVLVEDKEQDLKDSNYITYKPYSIDNPNQNYYVEVEKQVEELNMQIETSSLAVVWVNGIEIQNGNVLVTLPNIGMDKENLVTIQIEEQSKVNTYVFHIRRLGDTTIEANNGNSIYGIIENLSLSIEEKENLKNIFENNNKYMDEHYLASTWNGKNMNYDKNLSTLFVNQTQAGTQNLMETGIVISSNRGVVLNVVDISLTVKILKENTNILQDDFKESNIENVSISIDKASTTNILERVRLALDNKYPNARILPDVYTLKYNYIDGDLPKTYTRDIVVLSQKGDIDLNGIVDITDANLVLNRISKPLPYDMANLTYTGKQIYNRRVCDISRDGVVNAIDYMQMKKMLQ